MKRIIALFAFILTVTFVNAQAAQSPTPIAERAHTESIRWQKQLSLTAEQTTQVEAVIVARMEAIEAIKADATKTQEQKDAAIATVRAEKEAAIMALLTPDQQAQYTAIKKQRQDRKNGTQNQE